MRCQDIMKKNVSYIMEKDTVQKAAQKMRDENIGFLPVCDDQGKVLGTLTDRDIAIRLCASNKTASQTKVSDIMTREKVFCRPDDPINHAETLMGRNHKSRMMVLDNQDRLVGIISLSDIATHERDNTRTAQTMREVSQREVHP